MSTLALEATKRIESLDDSKIKLVIRYIETLDSAPIEKKKRKFGVGEGRIPDISLEDLNSCNDEIAKMFENGSI